MAHLKTIILLLIVFTTACNEQHLKQEQQVVGVDSTILKVVSVDSVKEMEKREPTFCINYEEINSWDNVSDSYGYDFKAFVSDNKDYLKGEKHLTTPQVMQLFMDDKDTVDITNIWTDEVVSHENTEDYLKKKDFYLTDTLAGQGEWTAFIIEQIEQDGSQKFLVTVNKDEKPISKRRIAFYNRSGTYTANDEGLRLPWFAIKSACFYSDFTFETESQSDSKTYTIDKRGYIVEAK